VPSSRPATQRNRSSANHRVQGEKNAKNGAIWVLSLHYFCFAFACLPALYVEQVNERKLVCVCGAWKSCFEASSLPAPTSIFGARLDRSKAAGTYQISHTGQVPARVVWMTFAC
jgi:hypothetical protein